MQRGDAGIGGLQYLHAVADAVEQVADVAGAGVEAGGGEEVGRVVERAVDLLARGEAGLRGREQLGCTLQGEQILANCRGEDNIETLKPSLSAHRQASWSNGIPDSQPKPDMNKSF